MKLCFHLDNLSLRGTTTAVLDYAEFNELILNNESIIAFNEQLLLDDRDENFSKRHDIVRMFKEKYSTIVYSSKENLKKSLDSIGCDHIYFLKSGFVDENFLDGKINLMHNVFNFYSPHGDKYAYVSKWLSDIASGGKCGYVPHIVSLPKEPSVDIRKELGIDKDKLVIGRYGGFDQFDIGFVHNTVSFFANSDPNIVFLFLNTRKFIDHPNVKFLPSVISKQDKTNFILACDAMIHARSDGESFGLSICEFLFHNKPVISFGGGRDKNNLLLLNEYGLIYNNQYQLIENMFKLKLGHFTDDYAGIVSQFSPNNVMNLFNEVFLK